MQKYELVAIDIDGTLLKDNGKLSKKTLETINKCKENNVKVCLCTGRNIKNTIKVAKKLKNDMPFICADGAIFYDSVKNEIISEKLIDENTFIEIVKKVNELNLYVEFCTKEHYIKFVKDEELEKFSYGGVPHNPKEKFYHYFIKKVRYVKNLEKFINENKKNINQFLIAGEKEELEKIKEFFSTKEYSDIDVRYDLWEQYIFIVPKNCSKAYGLDTFSKHFNISIENMIAIGDQMNDIDMIKHAGLGVAMGNAHDEIKKNAKFVTKSNEEDGVSFVLEKFIINK